MGDKSLFGFVKIKFLDKNYTFRIAWHKMMTRAKQILISLLLHVGMRLSQSSNYFRPMSACHTNQAAFVSFNEAASMHQMPRISTQMTFLICSNMYHQNDQCLRGKFAVIIKEPFSHLQRQQQAKGRLLLRSSTNFSKFSLEVRSQS